MSMRFESMSSGSRRHASVMRKPPEYIAIRIERYIWWRTADKRAATSVPLRTTGNAFW